MFSEIQFLKTAALGIRGVVAGRPPINPARR